MHQGDRIDIAVAAELQESASAGGVNLDDAQPGSAAFDASNTHQVAGRLRKQAEAIDEFHLQLAQFSRVLAGRYALVQDQSQVYIRNIVIRKQRGYMQVDVETAIQRAFQVGLGAVLQRFDGTSQQLGIQREPDFLYLATLGIAQ